MTSVHVAIFIYYDFDYYYWFIDWVLPSDSVAGVFRVHDSMTFYPFPSFDLVLQIVLSHVLSPWFGVFVHFSVFGFCRIVTVPFI